MKPGVFREEYIAIIIRELLRGLEYLHTEGKLHRDIKGNPVVLFSLLLLNIVFLPQLQISSFLLGVK